MRRLKFDKNNIGHVEAKNLIWITIFGLNSEEDVKFNSLILLHFFLFDWKLNFMKIP